MEYEEGRRIVYINICRMILAMLANTALGFYVQGSAAITKHVVILIIVVGLCLFLYRGSRIARWSLIILMGFMGFLGLLNIVSPNILSIIMSCISLLYLWSAVVLVSSSEVKKFLIYRRLNKGAAA